MLKYTVLATRITLALLVILLFTKIAQANNLLKPNDITGIYGNKDEDNYLEIVSTNKNDIYFYASLFFPQGHQCEVYGIAEHQQDNKFSYNTRFQGGTELPEEKVCSLTIAFQNNKIIFSDSAYNCAHLYCGARGYLDGIAFKTSERKKLDPHHLQKILKSGPYQSALEEYKMNSTASTH